MLQKSAMTNLTRAAADLAFAEAQTLPGAVVEMIEQDNGRFTVTVVWDDSGAVVHNDELDAFERMPLAQAAAMGALAGATRGAAAPPVLGALSMRFESSGKPGAIGFDTTGGFSYGAYQIAAKTGTLKRFLDFLDQKFKAFGDALQAAGGAAAGLAGSEAFKGAWRDLALREPRFADAQHDFIGATHYEPFLLKLRQDLSLDVATRSRALKDVAWSVAVQHGPANKVFSNALAGRQADAMGDGEIIQAVYTERSNLMRYFPSSTPRVRESLAARFAQEQQLALNMLGLEPQILA